MVPLSTPSAALLIVAAGEGSRLGAGRRKALVPLGGRPLVEHSLRRLLALPELAPVVVVGHRDDRAALEDLAASLPRPTRIVDGGARRQDSVLAGLRALRDEAGAPELVLVHDAARPFVPAGAIPELIVRAAQTGAAILALPVVDTIKEARADRPDCAGRTLERERLWAAQTPQAFRRAELLALLEQADAERRSVTDEAALYEAAGRAVAFVTGSRLNFKLTTPADLALAEALLTAGPERIP
jgi:2-C-methyl-D-erythritol 4-phosphate cytidylyltransferase/2-C-methyl-D-erythritol 2,4-cyclodiphosphate synthase